MRLFNLYNCKKTGSNATTNNCNIWFTRKVATERLLFQFSGRFHDKSHSCTTYLKALSSYKVSHSESVIGISSFEGHGSSPSQSVTMTSAQNNSAKHLTKVVNQNFRWLDSHFLHTSSYLSQQSSTNTFKSWLPYWPRNFVEITAFYFLIPGWNWGESYKEIQRLSGVPYVVC
jgi:hypothetical protein